MYIRTSFVCSSLRVFYKGLLTQNATWCQNRGWYLHLFSKENIWSNPHASSIHPVIQTSTIILWTELFPKKRREKIQGENFNLSSSTEYSGVSTNNTFLQELQCFHTQSSKFPVIPCYSTYRINSTTRNLQEILQLQGSSRAGSFQQLFPCLQAFYMAE